MGVDSWYWWFLFNTLLSNMVSAVDYCWRAMRMSSHDIFPMSALAVLGALEGKTAEEMAHSLLEEEEEMEKERSEE